MRTVIHFDMDAFFASVEQLDDPELRGKPVLVGARSKRGVVTAASYEARPTGVRSAMSMVEALRRCPGAVVVPPRRSRYLELSRQVFSVFRRYTPLVEGLSVDEAFLDVSGSRALFGDGEHIARRIKREIHGEIGLTGSAGVAPNKFVAKIASDLDKPDGLVLVPTGSTADFLAPLPLERMWRVGPKARVRLRAAGFQTIGDLARADAGTLEQLLGSWGSVVRDLARGIDDRPVVVGAPPKSLGSEETFETDLRTRDALLKPILRQSMRVADRLVEQGLWARVVTLKIKYRDHRIRSRQMKLSGVVSDTDAIFDAASELLGRFDDLAYGVRLTGVSVSNMTKVPDEELFPDAARERRERLAATGHALRERFGTAGLTRASLIREPSVKRDSHT
ncbi:MAG: DNA polymerase IV [Myxococcales bacterium]|nr:DNA polymerase IV [Myxococcales bacterium]MDH3483353.1 DNA polymerase IV [Myxococcales bacterium]